MWRVILYFLLMLCASAGLYAQQSVDTDAIMKLIGTDSPEELDSYEVERLSAYLERPIPINLVSYSKLVSSGLFSKYQAASLADYRLRHGDVLSLSELSSVYGFDKSYVELLAPFISLESYVLPGRSSQTVRRCETDIALRSGLKAVGADDDRKWNYGIKYRFDDNRHISAGLAVSSADCRSSVYPDRYSGYLGIDFRRHAARVVVGDFNLRFGQGLVLWNGMTLSSVTSPSAFLRNPSGISSSWSYTGAGAFTGLASEMTFGRLTVSTAVALPGVKYDVPDDIPLLPAANVSWRGKNGHISVTHYAEFSGVFNPAQERIPDMKSGADMSLSAGGVDYFAELAYDWISSAVAGIGGMRFHAGENLSMAAMLRYYPVDYSSVYSGAARSTSKCSNEYAASLSGRFSGGKWVNVAGRSGFGSGVRSHVGTFSVDLAHFPRPKSQEDEKSIQIKSVMNWEYMMTERFLLKMRVSERLRTWGHPFRTDVRADLCFFLSGKTILTMRLNFLKCDGTGILCYMEGSHKTDRFGLHLRQGLFLIDDWDDRIYAYERDAPGSFNVPAFYGRGVWTSALFSWRFAPWGRLYMRASLTACPFMPEKDKKPGKAELKIIGSVSF